MQLLFRRILPGLFAVAVAVASGVAGADYLRGRWRRVSEGHWSRAIAAVRAEDAESRAWSRVLRERATPLRALRDLRRPDDVVVLRVRPGVPIVEVSQVLMAARTLVFPSPVLPEFEFRRELAAKRLALDESIVVLDLAPETPPEFAELFDRSAKGRDWALLRWRGEAR
ncbi:MAG: hypothetical protein R3F20_13130 [Planctomycetota bacterium]